MNITPLRSKHFTIDFKKVCHTASDAMSAALEMADRRPDVATGFVSVRACGEGKDKLYFPVLVHSKRPTYEQQSMIRRILAYRNLRLLEYRTLTIEARHELMETPSTQPESVQIWDADNFQSDEKAGVVQQPEGHGDSIVVAGTQQGITSLRYIPEEPTFRAEQIQQENANRAANNLGRGLTSPTLYIDEDPSQTSLRQPPSTPTTLWGRIRQAARRLFKR